MGTDSRLDVTGLKLDPNPFTRAPKGSLARAENIVLDRPGVARSRRGHAPYGDEFSTAPVGDIRCIASYKDRLVVHHDDVLSYDSDGAGTWVDYVGMWEPRTGHQLRPVEAGGSLFIATADGVQKLDELAGEWAPAGVPKALDGDVALSGGSGFMATATAVAYRLVWIITDAQGREVVGAPSGRVVIGNGTGGSRDVAHTWYVPDDITTDHRYQLYRSGPAAGATAEPNDELQLVREAAPTSGEIVAGQLTFTDSVPDALRGAFLYTSPSQEGIAQAAERPPLCSELALYNGMMVFGDIAGRHRLAVTLLEAGSDGVHYSTLAGNTTATSAVVGGIASTATLRVGMRAKNANIPSTAEILTVDSANQVTLTLAATGTAVGTSIEFQDVVTVAGRDYYAATAENATTHEFLVETGGTPAVNVQATALSLVYVINLDAGNSSIYAYYSSGFADLPGMMLFEERGIGGAGFSSDSSAPQSFDPELPEDSDADETRNGLMLSKPGEFEAVPLGNVYELGAADKPVQRVIPLRESALVFKADGVWRMLGDSPEDITFTSIDSTLALAGLETATRFSGEVLAMTNQGAVAVGESAGTRLLNQDIHRALLAFAAQPNFAQQAWAVAYEADRKWVLALPTSAAATSPRTMFVFDIDSSQWTEWTMARAAGCVHTDGRLYFADPDTSRLTQERKALTRYDYADDSRDVTIVSSIGTLVTVNSTANINDGWTLVQGLRESVIVDVVDGITLEVTDTFSWAAGDATAYQPIAIDVEWVPIDGGAPHLVKQFPEMSLYFDPSEFNELHAEFRTDLLSAADPVELTPGTVSGGWGTFAWGAVPWGQSTQLQQVIRTLVPLEAQRGHWLIVRLQLEQAFTSFSLLGATVQVLGGSERFRGSGTERTQSPLSGGEGL